MKHKTVVVFESDWEFVTSERDRLRAEVEALKSLLKERKTTHIVIPDYKRLHNEFVELVAMRFHASDQIQNGVMSPDSVTAGWLERYRGTLPGDLSANKIEINRFKDEVDNFVAMLMQVVQKEHDERMVNFGDT